MQDNYQTRKRSDASERLDVPEWDERVRASDCEVVSGFVELDADAVAGMGLQHVLQLHLRVEVDVDAALKEIFCMFLFGSRFNVNLMNYHFQFNVLINVVLFHSIHVCFLFFHPKDLTLSGYKNDQEFPLAK